MGFPQLKGLVHFVFPHPIASGLANRRVRDPYARWCERCTGGLLVRTSGLKQPTDINKLCDEYLRLDFHGLKAKDKSFNTTIKTDFDSSLEKVEVVQQDIGRVVLNLVSNAFYEVNEKKKRAEPGFEPTVWLKTKKINGKVEILVRENGSGIPQQLLNKIYQPFFTTKPTGEGTGLGLSLAYDIVTKGHTGDISIETEEGNGTTFIVTLPYST